MSSRFGVRQPQLPLLYVRGTAAVAEALEAYEDIPIRFVDVDLGIALQIAAELSIYAYHAYLIACARQTGAPLLTLDRGLARAARRLGVQVLEAS